MERITHKVISHLSLKKDERYYVREVAHDKGKLVASYPKLVQEVASIGYGNPKYQLFFRGQKTDYDIKVRGKFVLGSAEPKISSVLPKIFRNLRGTSATYDELAPRMRQLEEKAIALLGVKGLSDRRFHLHPELRWAVLQHYGLADTPLVDVTQSLRVAASFASSNKGGYVYVFGFPALHGSISYFIDEGLTVVRLQSACPPYALRPHFQEGYLVGHYPHQILTRKKEFRRTTIAYSLNLSNRMLAKYRIANKDRFWIDGFSAIPPEHLEPTVDPVKDELNEVFDI